MVDVVVCDVTKILTQLNDTFYMSEELRVLIVTSSRKTALAKRCPRLQRKHKYASVLFFFFSGPLYILLSFIIEIECSSLEIATDCGGYKYNGFTTYFPSLDNSVCNLSGVASFGDAGSVFARNTTIFVLQCK